MLGKIIYCSRQWLDIDTGLVLRYIAHLNAIYYRDYSFIPIAPPPPRLQSVPHWLIKFAWQARYWLARQSAPIN